ncbi:PPA5 phosphatase, partial [Gymnorhina tibicen]|nr:PPA5 phosphatase [Gymnorhina tibicen]
LTFLALGDWGGLPDPPFVTPREVATAAAMGRAVTELGGDFVLALGDNFYYEGVRDEWDPRFQVTPGGGHPEIRGAGGNGASCPHCRRVPVPVSPISQYPHIPVPQCPHIPTPPLSPCSLSHCPRILYPIVPVFVLVAGHYPVWSVAKHGPTPCLVRLLRPLLRRHRVTAYLCGHDHNLQYLEEGGVGYVLSGAGNFMEDSRPHDGSVPPGSLRFFFGTPTSPGGFAHLRLEPGAVTVTFLEATGRVLHRVTLPPR